jgi:A/G-specific adenine glycosylase
VGIRQRAGKDIWEGLYEFVLHETGEPLYFDKGKFPASALARQLFGRQSLTVKYISQVYRQELTHQTIQGQFITVGLQGKTAELAGYRWVDREQLADYPFPKFINGWLQDPTPAQTLF